MRRREVSTFIGGRAWLAARAAASVADERIATTQSIPIRGDTGARKIAMRTARLVLAAAVAALALALGSHGTRAQPNPEPMIFLLAKGERDACGPGCSEWIAAEGMFDGPQVERRFRDLLDVPWARQRFKDKPDDFFIAPAAIADEAWHVANQPRSAWSFNVEVRPFGETW
jgi:hypothetical protein